MNKILITRVKSVYIVRIITGYLSIIMNDILKTDKSNCWEDRYGNIITGMKSDRDTRYVRLGIKFIINDMKNNIKGRFNNNEELNRL
jgi:hypothetical protein